MARPERHNVDYFPFFCKEGKAMYYVEQKYGNDGYASWVKILRQLAVTNNHYLNLSNKVELMFLSSKCRVSEEMLCSLISDLCSLGEFDENLWIENKIIYSSKFIESVKDAYLNRKSNLHDYHSFLQMLSSLGIKKLPLISEKEVDNTQRRIKKNKEENNIYHFEDFWQLYPNKSNRKKCETKWKSISDIDKQKIKETLPSFIEYLPFASYRHPNPLTYLNGERWNDELPNLVVEKNNLEKPLEDISDEIKRLRGW